MKMSMYELLGLVKDGKAPKKIKYEDRTYTLYLNEENNHYYQDDKCKYFLLSIRRLDDLNDEVEILEEEKKIEHIDLSERIGETCCISPKEEKIQNKINEIIDKLNKE